MAFDRPCPLGPSASMVLAGLFLLAAPLYAQADEGRAAPGPACRPYLEFDLAFSDHDPGNIADCIVEMHTHDYQLAQKVYEKVLSITGEEDDYIAKALRSAMQPVFIRAAIAAEFDQACDSFRQKPGPNPYLTSDGSFDDLDKIMRWVERIACGMQLEHRRPEDFLEMAGYLLVITEAGPVPDQTKVSTAEDGAYLDAAIRYALTHSLTKAAPQ